MGEEAISTSEVSVDSYDVVDPDVVLRQRFARSMQACVQSESFEAPKLPHLATEILKLAEDDDVGMAEVAALLAKDPGLTARVLHLANSAFLGGRSRIEKLSQAMARLGMTSLRQLIVAYAMKGEVFECKQFAPEMAAAWQHSVGAGVAADLVARKLNIRDERVFVAGLLHDIGRPLALHVATDVMKNDPELRSTTRDEVLGLVDRVHSLLGKVIAEKWKLPECYLHVVTHHHAADPPPDKSYRLVQIVQVADCLCHVMGLGYPMRQDVDPARHPAAISLGLTGPQLGVIQAHLIDKAEAFMLQ